MGVVKGAISIKDNATAVLKSIKKEQTAFRKDVENTKKALTRTWDKRYSAKLSAAPAMKAARDLKKKLDPLRKKVVTAVALKDMATAKIKKVTNKVKTIGKMVARPVVTIAVKGTQALSGIGKGIIGAAKVAAVGVAAISAAGAAGLKALFSGSTEAAKAQIEAETKLEAVLGNVKSIQAKGAGAAQQAKQNLMGVASSLQKVGVIGDEVTLAGMQQLATFQLSDKEISKLAGGMTDLLAQQKGLNATQQDAVNIGNLIGKAMQGQTGALSRVGITFDKAQAKAMKTGTAEQRAAVLAEILKQNVGGVNQELAKTDQGKIQQMSNAWGDMKEEVGKVTLSLKAKFASVVMKNIPLIQKLGTTLMKTISKFAKKALPVIDRAIKNITPAVRTVLKGIGKVADGLIPVLSNLFAGMQERVKTVLPVLTTLIAGFQPLLPQLAAFGTSVSTALQQIAIVAMPVVTSIITTVQNVIPAVLPVLQTVISTISAVISQAAPIISGMVEGIGTVVTTLAPVFETIFTAIGEKVGSVIGFVSERMGFIQEVISQAAPLIGDIISTAWGVISPVIDIAIAAFETVFGVVQRIFPGIQRIMEAVWKVIKPIVEGVGGALKKISGGFKWVADKIGIGGGKEAGKNAKGDNNWRGGLTWVGEQGPELINLPKGTRILPNKESVAWAQKENKPVINQMVTNSVTKETIQTKPASVATSDPVLANIEKYVGLIAGLFTRRIEGERLPSYEDKGGRRPEPATQKEVNFTIAKLADTIIVREQKDMDEIADAVAKKVIKVVQNM